MNLKSIKTRLLVYYTLSITVLLSLFVAILINTFYNQSLKMLTSQLLLVAQDIDHDITTRYNNNFIEGFDEENELMINNLFIKVIDKSSNPIILASNNKLLEIESDKKVKKGEYAPYNITKNEIELIGISYKSLYLEGVYLEIETTVVDKIDEPYESLLYFVFILTPLVMLVFIAIGFFMIRDSFKSVKKVINQVHTIEIENLSKRIERFESNDELDELIDTFNSLLNRVDDGMEKIKRFSNDVSHELKTPLTVIRGEIELALRKDRQKNEYKETLQNLLEETKNLQDMIDSLLFLSTQNKDALKQEFVKVELDLVLVDVIEELHTISSSKNIQIDIQDIMHIEVIGNELLLKVMISNLLQNALKYSKNNSKVEISLNKNGLLIKDYGIGIKEEELTHIFDRFYRTDKARVRDGFGLGLSIVLLITKLHNFTIDIQSSYEEYTQVRIDFDT